MINTGSRQPSQDKLCKLLLMLLSTHDGEVVSAARAIGRELKAEGQDWHWLVKKLNGHAALPASDANLREEVEKAICANWEARHRFRGKQQEFVESMFERWCRYGSCISATNRFNTSSTFTIESSHND